MFLVAESVRKRHSARWLEVYRLVLSFKVEPNGINRHGTQKKTFRAPMGARRKFYGDTQKEVSRQ